ncbi:MAG: hypothetical protein E2O52_07280, partial [Gammaproteobacteria bacterium]
MKRICIAASLLAIGACGNPVESDGTAPDQVTPLGFEPSELATDTRPQDDFFAYVNGLWIERTEIPAEWSRYGTMQIVHERTEARVRALIETAAADTEAPAGSDVRKIGDLYRSFMNEARADSLGLEPIADDLKAIDALDSYDELIVYFAHAMINGVQVPVKFYIDANAADPDTTLAYFWQDGLGLPDRDYYLRDTDELISVREQYALHIERLFTLAGWPDGPAAARLIPALEQRIAVLHWSRVQNRDREKIYTNKYTLEEADALSPGFPWLAFLEAGGFGQPGQIIIAQTEYFSALGKLVRDTPLDTWRAYLRLHTLKSFAPYLNDNIVRENFNFEKRTL